VGDRNESVAIEFDRLVRQTPKAFLVEVEGEETWVAKSQVENEDELSAELLRPNHRKEGLDTLWVPRWLAQENGWIDDYD
jgi:3-deoxy-D-manno-octulosonic-acid transferase